MTDALLGSFIQPVVAPQTQVKLEPALAAGPAAKRAREAAPQLCSNKEVLDTASGSLPAKMEDVAKMGGLPAKMEEVLADAAPQPRTKEGRRASLMRFPRSCKPNKISKKNLEGKDPREHTQSNLKGSCKTEPLF